VVSDGVDAASRRNVASHVRVCVEWFVAVVCVDEDSVCTITFCDYACAMTTCATIRVRHVGSRGAGPRYLQRRVAKLPACCAADSRSSHTLGSLYYSQSDHSTGPEPGERSSSPNSRIAFFRRIFSSVAFSCSRAASRARLHSTRPGGLPACDDLVGNGLVGQSSSFLRS
jgi:hypothetical protein